MTRVPVLLDTGPLVSYLSANAREYKWVVEQWRRLEPPMLTCEPVLTEASFLLKREGRDPDAIFELMDRGVIRAAISIQQERADLRALLHRYRNRPISLADACLVRLSEIHAGSVVFTLDSDFRIYRQHGNRVIPLRIPD